MDDIDKLLRKYEGLIRATACKYTRQFGRSTRYLGNSDDHLAEARIAAWRALVTYDDKKQTKVETYMIGCIKNRMIDLTRRANRPSRPSLHFEDRETLTMMADLIGSYDRAEETDDRLVYAKLLDPPEFETLCHFLDGGGLDQLVRERCRKTPVGSTSALRGEIVQCLRRIQLKLKSNGLSLSV